MIDFGMVRPGTTLYIPFATYDSNDPTASVTMTGFAVTDIEIYKDGGTTQRASDNGYALLDTDGTDFDGLTGIHGFSVDLADNSTAGFYAAGSQYWVVVSSVTIDAGTISFIAATFRIGMPDAVLNTTIASLSSQTSFTLTAGPAEDNALVGCPVYIHDVASAVQGGYAVISAYTGSTKTVTLTAGTTYTVAATDNIAIFHPVNTRWIGATLQTGRDVGTSVLLSSGTGTGQLDFTSGVVKSNVTQYNGSAGTFSGGRPEVNTSHIAGSAVSTSTAQIGVNVVNAGGTAWGSGAITAASVAASAFNGKGDWNVGKTGYTLTATTGLGNQTANITGNLSGSVGSVTGAVGSVTGAVGSVTGNVGGNVTGSVGSVATGGITTGSFAAGAINAAAIAADAIGASELAADAATEIAGAVWDLARSGHSTAGTFGEGVASVQGSVTGSVASVSGAVGSVTGAVGSVTGNVGGNVTGSVGSVTGAVGSVTGNVGGNVTGSVGSVASGGITSSSFATGAITATAIAADAIGASELAADAANEIADAILDRNVSGGSSTGRTVKQALHALRNKVVVSSGTMTVYDTDDASSSWTASVTGTAGADPVTTIDPA